MKKITTIGLRIVGILGGIVLLLGVGGYLYLRVNAPHFLAIAHNIEEEIVTIPLEELDGAVFVQGMNACENLNVDPESMRVYVSDLGGSIHLLDGESREQLKIVKSLKMGQFGLGIDQGSDGSLYVGVSQYGTQGWIDQGGAIYRVDPELHQPVKLTTDYPAMNGLACDSAGRCYFASSNYDFFHPEGNVYVMQIAPDGSYSEPEIFLQDIGLANGLHYNAQENRMYLSDTLEMVSAFIPGEQRLETIYRKTKYLEATDDICTDHQGNLWMSDPFESTLKNYNPKTKQLVRYDIEGRVQSKVVGDSPRRSPTTFDCTPFAPFWLGRRHGRRVSFRLQLASSPQLHLRTTIPWCRHVGPSSQKVPNRFSGSRILSTVPRIMTVTGLDSTKFSKMAARLISFLLLAIPGG